MSYCCFGKVLTEPLPSNGHVLQIIIYISWRCRECTAFNSSASVRLYSEVLRLWECFTCIVRCQDMLVKNSRRYDWTQGKFHLMCVNKMYAWVDSCTWSLPLQLKAESLVKNTNLEWWRNYGCFWVHSLTVAFNIDASSQRSGDRNEVKNPNDVEKTWSKGTFFWNLNGALGSKTVTRGLKRGKIFKGKWRQKLR